MASVENYSRNGNDVLRQSQQLEEMESTITSPYLYIYNYRYTKLVLSYTNTCCSYKQGTSAKQLSKLKKGYLLF